MKALFILNEGPYGSERSYNGLRLARSTANKGVEAKVFLIGDAVGCAKDGQKMPQGYYNIGDMLGAVIRRDAEVGVCGSCMDARGIKEEDLLEGSHRSSMDQLTDWTIWADKVIVF